MSIFSDKHGSGVLSLRVGTPFASGWKFSIITPVEVGIPSSAGKDEWSYYPLLGQ